MVIIIKIYIIKQQQQQQNKTKSFILICKKKKKIRKECYISWKIICGTQRLEWNSGVTRKEVRKYKREKYNKVNKDRH